MQQIRFYLDFVSPYAYLAFERLPHALQNMSYGVRYQPVLLGAVLKHFGHEGPVAIAAKRLWTYRHVQWLGHANDVPLRLPAMHPFNPLPLLRLALACAEDDGCINRHVAGTLLRHVWAEGGDPNAPDRLEALQAQLTCCAATRRPQKSRRCCAPTPTTRSPRACSACPVTGWTSMFYGGSTPCRCCAPDLPKTAGSISPAGTRRWRSPAYRWSAAERVAGQRQTFLEGRCIRAARKDVKGWSASPFCHPEATMRVCPKLVRAGSVWRKPVLV